MKDKAISIFLVEQQAEMNNVILSILHELNFENIHVFHNTSTAWQAFQKTPPEIVICDWYPGRNDTLTFLQQVRTESQAPETPFLIISGIVEHSMVKQAVSMGVNEYIVKPFNVKIIEEKIDHALHFDKLSHVRFDAKVNTLRDFDTKVGICVSQPELLTLVNQKITAYPCKVFVEFSQAVKEINSDKLFDVLIIDEHTLIKHAECHPKLIKLAASGQIETLVIVNNVLDKAQTEKLRSIGFTHFVYPEIDSEDIKVRTELLVTLKKAMLHTKDTVKHAALDKLKQKEFQNKLLQSIQAETSNINHLGTQIVSTSKKSSFSYQLGEEIAQSAKAIESFTNVIASTFKDPKELQQSPKDKVSLDNLFNNARNLFEKLLRKRKIRFVYEHESSNYISVNPILFTSLFMFFLRSVIKDAKYDSSIELYIAPQNSEQSLAITIKATVLEHPQLKEITERSWFDKQGKVHFVLKKSIQQLCDSQLTSNTIDFEPSSSSLEINMVT